MQIASSSQSSIIDAYRKVFIIPVLSSTKVSNATTELDGSKITIDLFNSNIKKEYSDKSTLIVWFENKNDNDKNQYLGLFIDKTKSMKSFYYYEDESIEITGYDNSETKNINIKSYIPKEYVPKEFNHSKKDVQVISILSSKNNEKQTCIYSDGSELTIYKDKLNLSKDLLQDLSKEELEQLKQLNLLENFNCLNNGKLLKTLTNSSVIIDSNELVGFKDFIVSPPKIKQYLYENGSKLIVSFDENGLDDIIAYNYIDDTIGISSITRKLPKTYKEYLKTQTKYDNVKYKLKMIFIDKEKKTRELIYEDGSKIIMSVDDKGLSVNQEHNHPISPLEIKVNKILMNSEGDLERIFYKDGLELSLIQEIVNEDKNEFKQCIGIKKERKSFYYKNKKYYNEKELKDLITKGADKEDCPWLYDSTIRDPSEQKKLDDKFYKASHVNINFKKDNNKEKEIIIRKKQSNDYKEIWEKVMNMSEKENQNICPCVPWLMEVQYTSFRDCIQYMNIKDQIKEYKNQLDILQTAIDNKKIIIEKQESSCCNKCVLSRNIENNSTCYYSNPKSISILKTADTIMSDIIFNNLFFIYLKTDEIEEANKFITEIYTKSMKEIKDEDCSLYEMKLTVMQNTFSCYKNIKNNNMKDAENSLNQLIASYHNFFDKGYKGDNFSNYFHFEMKKIIYNLSERINKKIGDNFINELLKKVSKDGNIINNEVINNENKEVINNKNKEVINNKNNEVINNKNNEVINNENKEVINNEVLNENNEVINNNIFKGLIDIIINVIKNFFNIEQ